MYTAIATSITLKEDTPKEVIDIINHMIGGDWEDEPKLKKPDHAFLKSKFPCY